MIDVSLACIPAKHSPTHHVSPWCSDSILFLFDATTILDTFSRDVDWNQTDPLCTPPRGWTDWPSGYRTSRQLREEPELDDGSSADDGVPAQKTRLEGFNTPLENFTTANPSHRWDGGQLDRGSIPMCGRMLLVSSWVRSKDWHPGVACQSGVGQDRVLSFRVARKSRAQGRDNTRFSDLWGARNLRVVRTSTSNLDDP